MKSIINDFSDSYVHTYLAKYHKSYSPMIYNVIKLNSKDIVTINNAVKSNDLNDTVCKNSRKFIKKGTFKENIENYT